MWNVRAWIGLLVIAILVSGIGVGARAEPKPSDYWLWEFVAGEIGATLGGFAGAGACVRDSPCESWMHSTISPNTHGCGGEELGCAFFGMNIGRAPGASTGVVLAGMYLGVDGNIWAAYLATGIWYASILLMGSNDNLPQPLQEVEGWLIFTPGIPAALATIGYNIGAQMKSDKSKSAALSWQMPVIALRF